jgi:hypothetical protein
MFINFCAVSLITTEEVSEAYLIKRPSFNYFYFHHFEHTKINCNCSCKSSSLYTPPNESSEPSNQSCRSLFYPLF